MRLGGAAATGDVRRGRVADEAASGASDACAGDGRSAWRASSEVGSAFGMRVAISGADLATTVSFGALPSRGDVMRVHSRLPAEHAREGFHVLSSVHWRCNGHPNPGCMRQGVAGATYPVVVVRADACGNSCGLSGQCD